MSLRVEGVSGLRGFWVVVEMYFLDIDGVRGSGIWEEFSLAQGMEDY